MAAHDDDINRGNRPARGSEDPASQVAFLEQEIAVLRRKLADSPRHTRILEERIVELQTNLAGVSAQNERLANTLREARDQIVALKEEVDRLAQPPAGFGVFLEANEDGTADIFTGGRKLRVNVSPNVELKELRRGQELMLNEALNVVQAMEFERVGDIVTLKEILEDGERALVIGHTDEERVVRLAEPLLDTTIRAGDALLLEPRSGYVYEVVPKSEVEELVLEEVPDIDYEKIGGLGNQIELIRDAVELPYLHPDLFKEHELRPPKGVLLYGPPGTGKTLLARAVAGEAGVPFYSISGSDFVEMFVGVGASRVRDLFEQAKANAPAIVFVDEIDAVGRHRGAGMGGGHDEREQTLNQLLVEMDGFDVKGTVILIAATNRPDILDPALLRPGRFDRQIAVSPPDIIGRVAVLEVHSKGKPLAPDVNLETIARRTPGFTGADLANVINEAALLTARKNGRLITNEALEEAIDRVIAGPERKTRAMSDKEKRVTAYHEGGHALAAWAMPNLDPVHKVTILPRGRSLGHTLVLPLEDRYTQTRAEILDQLVYALGGRAAEELVFHEPTTGASNDIEKATALARSMVTEYGMSAKLGAVKYGSSDSEPFLGRDYGHTRDYSEEIASWIDEEVRGLIEAAHDEAWEILVQYRDVLDQLVLELAERETLNKEDLERIMAPVHKRPPHSSFTGFGKRTPSDRPPIEIPATAKPDLSKRRQPANGPVPVAPGSGSSDSGGTYGQGGVGDYGNGGLGQSGVNYPPAPTGSGWGQPDANGYPPPSSNGYPPAGSNGYPAGPNGYPGPSVNGYPPAAYPHAPGYPPPSSYPAPDGSGQPGSGQPGWGSPENPATGNGANPYPPPGYQPPTQQQPEPSGGYQPPVSEPDHETKQLPAVDPDQSHWPFGSGDDRR